MAISIDINLCCTLHCPFVSAFIVYRARIAGSSWTAQAAQHLSKHNECLLVEPQPVRGLRQYHLCWLRTAFKNYPFGTVQNFFCAEQGPFGTGT